MLRVGVSLTHKQVVQMEVTDSSEECLQQGQHLLWDLSKVSKLQCQAQFRVTASDHLHMCNIYKELRSQSQTAFREKLEERWEAMTVTLAKQVLSPGSFQIRNRICDRHVMIQSSQDLILFTVLKIKKFRFFSDFFFPTRYFKGALPRFS